MITGLSAIDTFWAHRYAGASLHAPQERRALVKSLVVALVLFVTAAAGTARAQALSDKAEALWEAARKGDVATVKKLLDEGLDVNTKLRYGSTALFSACDRGHIEVVKLLLDRGADVNVRDTFYGATPLTWAVNPATGRKPQHVEIVRLLLQKGAQGKAQALMGAVGSSDLAMTQVVLESGGLEAGTLSDALDAATAAKTANKQEILAALEKAGAKPRVEFKVDAATLARYAGTYRSSGGIDLVLTVASERLAGSVNGQRVALVARDATTFGVTEIPGASLTVHLEGDKVVSISFPNNGTIWTRVEGK
jgi:ankyrin repeat protein